MNEICSVCGKEDICRKKFDDTFYCTACYELYCCLNCNREYDRCYNCCKLLCNCISDRVIEYDYGGDLHFCKPCFLEQDHMYNMYLYFKNKYNETMSYDEIELIVKKNIQKNKQKIKT